jgi:invasion protein IalB
MRVGTKWTGAATGAIVAAAAIAMSGMWLPDSLAQTSAKSSKVAAADRKTVTMRYGGWRVTCDEAGNSTVCSAAFRVINKKTNATILTWLLGRGRDGQLLTEFFVPTEILVQPGVSMVLEDGPAYKAQFVACGRSACKAVLPLDAALASELANATKATLSLTASNGKVTNFSMGIEGIDAALAELGN